MTMILNRGANAVHVSAASILGAALVSAFAPGLLLGLGFAVTRLGRTNFLETLIATPLLLSLAGGVVGAPFAAIVFTPMILFLRRHWRLNGIALTITGYLSVFAIGVVHCVAEQTLTTGVGSDAIFAICGAVAGCCCWAILGDIEKVSPAAREVGA